jgi:hypothetical protein
MRFENSIGLHFHFAGKKEYSLIYIPGFMQIGYESMKLKHVLKNGTQQ